jgi:hypothetical protein
MVTTMPPVKRWLVPATTLLLLRAVPSCSSDSATAVPTEVSLQDIPHIFAKKACEVTLECLGPAADAAALSSDCEARVTLQFEDGEFALFEHAIDEGLVEYDGSLVAACMRSLDAAGCGILTNRFESLCPDLFKGHTAAGEPCSVDAECEESLFCRLDSACPGTCTRLAADGDACLQHNDCRDGLICGRSRTCVSPAADGDACRGDTDKECGLTSVCAGADGTTSGTCRNVEDAFSRGEGEECDPAVGSFCTPDFVCAAVAIEDGRPVLQCELPSEEPGESDEGISCHLAFPEACPDGQYCVVTEIELPAEPMRVEVNGKCQPLPGDGEPCGSPQPGQPPSRCRADAVCIEGTCRDVKRLGGECTEGSECYSGVCLEGACAATLCDGGD